VIPWGFWLRLAERGSTAKYGLSLRAGVVDTGYRGEIFVALTNCSNRPIVFNALPEEANHLSAQNPDYVFYPAGKAIVQGILEKKTLSTTYELTTEQFNALPSTERGSGKIGSSGK
jgi:dUTP pyrophosphatase